MPRIIEMTISPTGETTVQTKGYTSAECQQASKWLEQALGIVAADQKTGEFYERQANQQQIHQ
jgi:hypothetical protein